MIIESRYNINISQFNIYVNSKKVTKVDNKIMYQYKDIRQE